MIKIMSMKQNYPIIHVTADNGFQWEEHMRELAESNVDEVVNGLYNMTGLRLFMLAAMGNYSF